jgi:hypothetical protein
VHLRVEDPKEAEALPRELLDRNIHDLRIAHRVVVQVELVVRKHKARVVPLSTLDPPGRVDLHNLKLAQLVNQVLQVEEPQVAVDEGV